MHVILNILMWNNAMIIVYVSVYMKRNRLWFGDFLRSGHRKERMKEKKMYMCLVKKHLRAMKN